MKSSDHGKKKSVEQLDRIFSILGHEWGNSVNSLKVTLDVLCDRYSLLDDGKRLDLLHIARDQVARQHRFLNGLKAYRTAATGNLIAIKMDFFIDGYVKAVSERLVSQNIRFKPAVVMENCVVQGNPDDLERVLDLLVDNALDAVEGAREPVIVLSTFELDRFLNIVIEDNGDGLIEDQHKIFIPFFSTRKGRLGLGLPTARKLLAGMGGELKITNRPTGGSTARVRLVLHERH